MQSAIRCPDSDLPESQRQSRAESVLRVVVPKHGTRKDTNTLSHGDRIAQNVGFHSTPPELSLFTGVIVAASLVEEAQLRRCVGVVKRVALGGECFAVGAPGWIAAKDDVTLLEHPRRPLGHCAIVGLLHCV